MKCFLAFLLLASISAHASPSPRISGAFGIGQSSVSSAEGGTSRIENPIGLGFFIDYPYKGSYYLFAEHMRSAAGASTGVGFTGVGLKFYPWLSPAHFKSENKDSIEYTTIKHSGYAFYFAGSGGFAQASIPSKVNEGLNAALAAGLYVNGKAGVEYPMSERWGFKGEGNFAMSVAGAGSISYFNMIFGAYLDL